MKINENLLSWFKSVFVILTKKIRAYLLIALGKRWIMKKIVFVCLGNICRSPMAEFVMKELNKDKVFAYRKPRDIFMGAWEIQFIKVPKDFMKYAISFDSSKGSQQISCIDFWVLEVVGMDESNVLRDLLVRYLGIMTTNQAFQTPGVPDPWYTGWKGTKTKLRLASSYWR